MADVKGRERQIIEERIRKIQALRKEGINPYAYKFEGKRDYSESLRKEFAKLKGEEYGRETLVAGRIMTKRILGKIAFVKLQDLRGNIQIVFQKGETPDDVFKFLKKVDSGDIIGVKGRVFRTQRGELSIMAQELTILTKAILPLPEKWHGLKDKEERYRKRYLDLIMNPEIKEVFEKRAVIIDEIRNLLKEEGFLEVETPTLQTIYGGASAKPFITHLNALDIDLFLSISPELYLKKLIVGGYEKVFTICKNFRNEGIDALHNPEFTMIEYYIAYQNYEYHMKIAEKLFARLRKKLKLGDKIEYQGKKINLKAPFKRIKFRDLLLRETGIDVDKVDSFEKLKKEIVKRKLGDIGNCKHYGALLDELYKRVVRPKIIQPTFLTHYPVEMIALAKRNENDPRKINSVQLIINGAEIVKAYDELNDPQDQRERLAEQAKLLRKGDEEAMPMDESFISALETGMPPTAGFGMGIDRLVMLLTNQPSIRDVLFFPFMKPEGSKGN